jgi:RNA polymerase sigma-70 factor (ECF subfamily)
MVHEKLPVPLPFEALLQRHEREIMRYLLRMSGDRDDAADLFQETWLRAYRAYPQLHPESDVRPWLYAIATNLCRNRARNGARRARVIVTDSEECLAADTTGGHHCSFYETDSYAMVHLRQRIAGLPIKQRQALYLRYFGGLDYAEIATAMGCSQESARANVSQAMKKLKAAGCDQ